MKRIGFLLFLAGIILSSWYAARLVPEGEMEANGADGSITSMDRLAAWGGVAGLPFAIGTLLMIGGGVLARRAESQAAHPEQSEIEAAESGPAGTLAMLQELRREVAALPDGDPEDHAQDLHEALDRILEDLVPNFLARRSEHIAELGLARFAETIGLFANAERKLARAWSALSDEAWQEVSPCLQQAREAMERATESAQQA